MIAEGDSILTSVVKALEEKKELLTTNFDRFFQQFYKNLYTAGFSYMDNKLSSPYVLRLADFELLDETHPGHFGMNFFGIRLLATL